MHLLIRLFISYNKCNFVRAALTHRGEKVGSNFFFIITFFVLSDLKKKENLKVNQSRTTTCQWGPRIVKRLSKSNPYRGSLRAFVGTKT